MHGMTDAKLILYNMGSFNIGSNYARTTTGYLISWEQIYKQVTYMIFCDTDYIIDL